MACDPEDLLPLEIWDECIPYLTPREIGRLSSTCKFFHHVCNDDIAWRTLYLATYDVTDRVWDLLKRKRPAGEGEKGFREYFQDVYASVEEWKKAPLIKRTDTIEASTEGVWTLKYNDALDRLVYGTIVGTIHVRTLSDPRQLVQAIPGAGATGCIDFNRDLLVRTDSRGMCNVWRAGEEGYQEATSFQFAGKRFSRCTDSQLLGNSVLACSGDTVGVWDLATETKIFSCALPPDAQGFTAAQADDRWIFTGSVSGGIAVWDVRDGHLIKEIPKAHTSMIWSLDCTMNSAFTCSGDKLVKAWDLRMLSCRHTLSGHRSLVGDLYADESRLISAGNDQTLRVWNTQNGECMHELQMNDCQWAIQFDNDKIVSGTSDGEVVISHIREPRPRSGSLPSKSTCRQQ